MTSILSLISQIPETTLADLLGTRSRNTAEKILNSGKIEWLSKSQTQNSLNISYKPSTRSEPINITFRWTNQLLLDICSTDSKVWKIGQKLCSHASTVLLGIHHQLPFFDDDIITSEDLEVSPEKIEQQKQELKQKQALLASLKLDEMLVKKTLAEIKQFLESLVQTGLQRVSQATLEWINALVIKSRIAKLINIEKELKKLSSLLIRYFQKSPDLKFHDFLNSLSKTYNYMTLATGLLQDGTHPILSPVEIMGQSRSEYIPASNRDAFCLGVHGWISETGFVGVTAFFLSDKPQKNNIFTASNIRPLQYLREKSPIALYHMETHASVSFQDLSQGAFRFQNVKLNQNQHLSFHSGLVLSSIPSKDLFHFDSGIKKLIRSDWVKILNHLRMQNILPILPSFQFNQFFIIEPNLYGSFYLDEIRQEWYSPVFDKKRRQLMLMVPNDRSPHIARCVLNFQKFFEKDFLPNAIFGEITFRKSEVLFNPIAGYWYQGIKLKQSWQRQPSQGTSEYSLRLIFNFYLDSVKSIIFPEKSIGK